MMRIYVYNENCCLAGREVPPRELEQYDDPTDGGDWHSEEISEENARWNEAKRTPYHARIAKTIRGNLDEAEATTCASCGYGVAIDGKCLRCGLRPDQADSELPTEDD